MSERIRVMMAVLLASILPTAGAAQEEAPRRDPLKPPGTVEQTATPAFNADAWKLMSTLVAEGRRVAIINERLVGVGDWVGGARVLAIESGQARLDYRGREFVVTRPGIRVRIRE